MVVDYDIRFCGVLMLYGSNVKVFEFFDEGRDIME